MGWEQRPEFQNVVELIRGVKPSLADVAIKPEDLLIETLGMDSLDVTQLARAVRRKVNREFDQDTWFETAKQHRLSIVSLLEAATTATAG